MVAGLKNSCSGPVSQVKEWRTRAHLSHRCDGVAEAGGDAAVVDELCPGNALVTACLRQLRQLRTVAARPRSVDVCLTVHYILDKAGKHGMPRQTKSMRACVCIALVCRSFLGLTSLPQIAVRARFAGFVRTKLQHGESFEEPASMSATRVKERPLFTNTPICSHRRTLLRKKPVNVQYAQAQILAARCGMTSLKPLQQRLASASASG